MEGIRRVFMMKRPKTTLLKFGVFAGKSDLELEWTLETDGINLKVMCIDRVDHTQTYSNNCVEIFQTWVSKPDVLSCSQSFGTSSNLTAPT